MDLLPFFISTFIRVIIGYLIAKRIMVYYFNKYNPQLTPKGINDMIMGSLKFMVVLGLLTLLIARIIWLVVILIIGDGAWII